MGNYVASVYEAVPELIVSAPLAGDINLTPFLAAVVIFLLLSVLFKVVLMTLIHQLESLSKQTSTDIDDVVINAIAGVRPWVYSLIAFYVALQFFTIPDMLNKVVTALVFFAIAWQAIEVALCFVRYGVTRFVEKDEDGDGVIDPNSATASEMIVLVSRIVLWTLGGLFVLSNLGIEVTSLIAGLGIGGIAIAFALQGILSDLFASFSIYFDKPFRIGDFIVIGSDSGTVEKIGIKTTRLRTLQGEELVVSNAELTTVRVQNFKKLDRRRVVMRFGVTYETGRDALYAIPGYVHTIFDTLEHATLDRVHFATLADSALEFEVVYYIESDEYGVYMDMQAAFNYALMDILAAEQIGFAYPTQTLYVKKD